jgi:purine-nucleoside phosphorylase
MSIHIGAKPGQIAEAVLLPGDPLRAKFIADNLLQGAVCHNEVRGMLGFTGTYKGKKVSVQGTGMGMPSLSIYVNELIGDYGAKTLIRIGTCGCIQPDIRLRDSLLAMTASTDSNVNKIRFGGLDFAPTADFGLLQKAHQFAAGRGMPVRAGNIVSSDSFYTDDPQAWKLWAGYGALAIEMETAELYTLAAKHGLKALSILTVSDNIVTGERTTAEERQASFKNMVEIALEIV